jgi:hypothetical protein
MSDAGYNFERFFAQFQLFQYWKDMENTHEDSPWHREASVAVHTDMLINWYFDHYYNERDDKQRMLTLVGCLFHDVGKPRAQIIKFSEERGEYRAYHGHELISARMWTDFAMGNRDFVEGYTGFTLTDIANVALMIEYHVPFALKDKTKRRNLKTAFLTRMGKGGHQAWLDMLNCDQHGRISDDQEKKLADVALWMSEWEGVWTLEK